MKWLKKIHRHYYQGPQNMGAIKVPRFLGYQSFLLTLMHWFHYYVNRSFTLIGRILLLVCTLIMSYCLLDQNLPMAFIAFGLVGMYLVNLLIGYIFKPRVSLTRNIPTVAVCDSLVPITYQLENMSLLPCWDVKLDNIAYQGCRYISNPTVSIMAPRDKHEIHSTIKFKQRGLFFLPRTLAESSFPFGLWKWSCFGQGDREVRVLPKALNIGQMKLPFAMGENSPDKMMASEGAGMEFTSCREFRFGDNPRHIHWASWAKTSTPIIREMSEEGRLAVSILFDSCFQVNYLNKYNDVNVDFENSVSLLAGVSEYLANKNYCCRNLIVDEEFHQFSGSQPQTIHDELLNLSCDIEDIRTTETLEITAFALDAVKKTSGLVMILQNYDESRQLLVERITNFGITCKVILLGHQPPKKPGNYRFVNYSDLIRDIAHL